MQDGDEKPKRFERKPNFDMRAKISRDGRFWIIEKIETWILPRKYLDVIAQNHVVEKPEAPKLEAKPKRKAKRDDNSDGQGN